MADVVVQLRLESAGQAPAVLRSMADQAQRGAAQVKSLNDKVKSLDPQPGQQVARGYQQVEQAANRAADAARRANAEVAKTNPANPAGGTAGAGRPPGMPPQPTTQPGQPGAAPTVPGLDGWQKAMGETVAKLAAAGAVIAGVTKTFDGLGKAVDAHRNAHLSAEQRIRVMEESIPLFGDVAKAYHGLTDALTGKTEEIRNLAVSQAVGQGERAADLAGFQTTNPLRYQQQQAEARARQLAAAPLIQAPRREDFQSDRAFEEERRLTQPRMQQREAQAEARAAQETLASQRAEQEAQRQRVQQAAAEANRLKAESERLKERQTATNTLPGGIRPQGARDQALSTILPGAGIFNQIRSVTGNASTVEGSEQERDRLKVLAEVDNAVKKEQAEREKLKQLTVQTGQAAKEAAEAESRARQATLEIQKAQLEIDRERIGRAKEQAQAFGSLNAAEQAAAIQAAQQFKAQGGGVEAFKALTPEQRGILGQFGGDKFKELSQQVADQNEGFQQIQEALGNLGTDQRKALENQVAKIESEVVVNLQLDKTQLQKDLAAAFKESIADLVNQFKELVSNVKRDVDVSLDIANATR